MSLRATARAFPTLLRVGLADAVAYRAEMLVWFLATTMPLVMLAIWSAVARDAPVGPYGQPQFVAYFLATFIVRQITGSWVFYEMNFEVRNWHPGDAAPAAHPSFVGVYGREHRLDAHAYPSFLSRSQ